ncbi:VTT domain-containing protein [Cereibacter sphaeroides]|nr:VTT domain-containing protein [Cereibacter sphaeroides]
MGNADLLALIQDHGLLLMAPLALVEGPIVSVLGGYLAGRGLMSLSGLLVVVVLADLLGDALLYGVGRQGGRLLPARLRERLIARNARLQERLKREIEDHGTRLLVIGKLTHGAGFAVLMAAGAARYPFWRFLLVNLLATLVKSGALVALGWWMGDQWQHAELWLDRAIVLVVALALLGFGLWLHCGREGRA